MYEAYRVLQTFGWRGWKYAPSGDCDCGCRAQVGDGNPRMGGIPAVGGGVSCSGEVGSGCVCRLTVCRCACRILPEEYGGDIWLVEEGHPRKDIMLLRRFAIGDASIPSVDNLLQEDRFRQLLSLRQKAPRRREKAAAR